MELKAYLDFKIYAIEVIYFVIYKFYNGYISI